MEKEDNRRLDIIRDRLPSLLRNSETMELIAGKIEGGFVSDMDMERIFYLFDRLGVDIQKESNIKQEVEKKETPPEIEVCSKFVQLRKNLTVNPPNSLADIVRAIYAFMDGTGYKLPKVKEIKLGEAIAPKSCDPENSTAFEVQIEDLTFIVTIRTDNNKDIIVFEKAVGDGLRPVAY